MLIETPVERPVDFTIRPYVPEDEAKVLHLLKVCLTSATSSWDTPDLWRWKHFSSPFGPSYILVAQAGTGEIVGLRALMRWNFLARSQTVYAARPVDTATHPDFRRWGIFTKLSLQALEDLQAAGVHLIFNTPNPQSLPGYLKMGWSSIGLNTQAKIVNPAKSLPQFAMSAMRRKFGRKPGTPEQLNPALNGLPTVGDLLKQPTVAALVQQSAGVDQGQLSTERSPAYLKWRYDQHVSVKYHAVWNETHGQLDGCLILRPASKLGLGGLTIEELILARPEAAIAAKLIREAARLAGSHYLTSCFAPGSYQHRALAANGFHWDPRKTINLVARPLSPVEGLSPEQAQAWALSMGDLEFL
jgi:GNAT superfamily N-acetyltransferase